MNAALVGARELIGPIIAMTITLAAVYTPIALQGGLTGALFREFALTLAGAVFISGVVALVLSPMMSANLLPPEHVDHGFSGWVNRTFDRFRDWYGSHLDRTLKARPAVYIIWAGISLLARSDVPGDSQSGDEGTGAEGRSGRDLRNHHRAGQRDHRRYDSLCRCGRKSVSGYSGYAVHVSNHKPEQRIWRNGLETVGHAQDADERLSAE